MKRATPIGGQGFTLIELILVIGITMIISVVGLASYNFSIQKSRDTQRKSDLSSISKALEAFANDFGDYPADNGAGLIKGCDINDSFQAGSGSFSDCSFGTDPFGAFVNGQYRLYIAKLSNDPQTDKTYYYIKTSTGYALFSVLENVEDPAYQVDATTNFGSSITCGTSVNCNYGVTESGPINEE